MNDRVAAEVRAEMARQRLTVADLAARLAPTFPVSEATLYRRLYQESRWYLDEVWACAHALGCPIEQIVPEDALTEVTAP